MVIMLVNNKHK